MAARSSIIQWTDHKIPSSTGYQPLAEVSGSEIFSPRNVIGLASAKTSGFFSSCDQQMLHFPNLKCLRFSSHTVSSAVSTVVIVFITSLPSLKPLWLYFHGYHGYKSAIVTVTGCLVKLLCLYALVLTIVLPFLHLSCKCPHHCSYNLACWTLSSSPCSIIKHSACFTEFGTLLLLPVAPLCYEPYMYNLISEKVG